MILLVITIFILNLIAFALNQSHLDTQFVADRGLISSFLEFLNQNIHGDLGTSSVTGRPVFAEIKEVFPATLELCFTALALSLIFGIPLGIIAGLYTNHWLRNLIISLTMFGYSIPVFWLGILFMMYSSLTLGWLPVSGRFDLLLDIPDITGFAIIDSLIMPSGDSLVALISVLKHLATPALVLAILTTAEVIRQLASSLSKVMQENYIKAAATKGLSKRQIIMRHALRNALPPIFPILGLQFGNVITMAMVTEVVFAWPGIGRWLINSIYQQDYAAIQGGMLVVASFVILVSVLTDILSALLHPLRRKEVYGQI
jgi:cationic peptide transport system permease protein